MTAPDAPYLDRRARRRRLLLGAGVPCGALLVACGGPPAGESQEKAAREPVTVRVTARQAQEADMWPVRLPAFNEAHPGVRAEADLHTGDIIQKIAALIASEEIGDVVHTHFSNAQPQRLFLGKATLDLGALAAREKLDLKQWYPQAVEASRLNGALIALPFKGKMAATVLFVNQTLLGQAGLKAPDLNTTLAELTELAARVTKADGSQWGFAGFLPKGNTSLAAAVRRHGAEVLSPDTKRAMLDSADARAAFGWWYDAFHRRRLMDPTANVVDLFSQGKAAILIGQDVSQQKSRIHPAAAANGFTYTATLVSKGPGGRRGGSWVPDALQLATRTRHPDEAWKLLRWLTDRETGVALAQQRSSGVSNTAGARPDVYNDPRFLDHPVFPRLLQELDRDSNLLPEPFQLPANFKIPEFDAVLGTYVDRVWKNEAEPTPSFMKALNDELQAVLALPMG